ncbi:class I SAM-dependent methyltransferase [Candidatus Parcubacteria bacterium]|nr:MAG: class I SAM-dependent methyltransferase [Candidatus Parcubacteria bacterium]
MKTVEEVKNYWSRNPLFSLEVKNPGSPDFFNAIDEIKKRDVESFAMNYWDFKGFNGKKVLDAGCGPGWLTVSYAVEKAEVYSVDLTKAAVELTRKFLDHKKAFAYVEEGSVEKLKFENNFFDLVVSSGVIHHTPDLGKGFRECFRVLKPGGVAKITLYHKGILHNKFVFPVIRFAMKMINFNRPGANLPSAKDADDFIRQYDGLNNPVGIGMNASSWSDELKKAGFVIENFELHFFPKRFIPFGQLIPVWFHYLLDRYFGTMIYFNLRKPNN